VIETEDALSSEKGDDFLSEQTFTAGIYVRLSRDDEREGESLSIENQKLILTSYVLEHGWTLHDVYVDDGYTGTNFDRPSLQRMIEDAQNKVINLIIVKDLSRFGRNYIQVGQFTDYIFPAVGCRFIALNDGVDTAENDNDIMPFKNLFNEFYSRDISKKVKTAKIASARNGNYLGCYAPYGYIRDPANHHRLIIQEEAAETVRRIFQMRRQKNSYLHITSVLNQENITSPRDYWYELRNEPNPRRVSHYWTTTTVMNILKNEAYIGNLVQFKTGSISYKNRKQVSKPQENHVRCENMHEPVIDRETWDIVQELNSQKRVVRKNKENELSLFAGFMECADCGHSMKFSRDYNTRKDGHMNNHHAYICGAYGQGGKGSCTSHRIMEHVITNIVLSDIRSQAALIQQDEKALGGELLKRKNSSTDKNKAKIQGDISKLEQRVSELSGLISKSYEEMLRGELPREMLMSFIQKYQQEQKEKTQSASELKVQLEKMQLDENDVQNWISLIKKYTDIQELDRELLSEIIERIYIGAKEIVDGENVQDITIVYKFAGKLPTI
jgi:DNA invertase Pin-like site-specific DNA recombinase